MRLFVFVERIFKLLDELCLFKTRHKKLFNFLKKTPSTKQFHLIKTSWKVLLSVTILYESFSAGNFRNGHYTGNGSLTTYNYIR